MDNNLIAKELVRLAKEINSQEENDADEAYKKVVKSIGQHIKTIEKKMKAHQEEQKKHNTNYGYVGDVEYVEHSLKQLSEFLNV